MFIGYSHNDIVMKYLARGLPPKTERFALTHEPDDPKWNDLRITAIGYPPDNEHLALHEALEVWAARLEMTSLDHRSRVREIVSGGPPKTPVEHDYLASAIATPVGVRAFAEFARGAEWLAWAETQQAFAAMFEPGSQLPDETRELVYWFARRFVEDDVGRGPRT